MSYTLTVNIEIGGTRHTGSNGETTPSTAGHAWMSLKNNDTNETVNLWIYSCKFSYCIW